MESEKLQWTKRLNQERVDSIYLNNFGDKYTEYRRLWNSAGKDFLPEFPIHLDFEVIDACNLSCLYCFRNKGVAKNLGVSVNTGTLFPLDLFKRIISEGAKYGLKAVNFGFSGECLLNPDLVEMVSLAHRFGVLDIRLLTNATLMTKRVADQLIDSPLTFLSFSIDAATPESYTRLKGKDHFNELISIIKYARQRKIALKKDFPLIRASFYSSPETKGEEEEFVKIFQDCVDFIDFQFFQNLRGHRQSKFKVNCIDPFRRLAIFADGSISPCCSFFAKKLIIGNANFDMLRDIWHSKAIQQVRESLVNSKPAPACVECLGSFV